jgi:hypothetical protein
MPRATDTIAAEANRLYWETETSVADIAQQLELSRRSLYDSVDPLPSGATCEACGSPLVYENRSGRNAGEEMCPHCDLDEEIDEKEEVPEAGIGFGGLSDDELDRVVKVGGAALAGAAIGAIATFLFVPRR